MVLHCRVIGPDSCFGNQVRGSDRIDITGRIEDIPEREGGRQLSFEELLNYLCWAIQPPKSFRKRCKPISLSRTTKFGATVSKIWFSEDYHD